MDRDGTRTFVQNVAAQYGRGYNTLLLMETAKIYYGGNIVVGDSDKNPIYAEVVQGTHADLVGAQQPIVQKLHRDTLSGFLRFDTFAPRSYDDPDTKIELSESEQVDVRRGIFGALTSIPHTTSENHSPGFELRDVQFRPGYYEFVLVKMRENGALTPIFIDCSDRPPFQPATY